MLLLCGALVFSGCYKKETRQEGEPSLNANTETRPTTQKPDKAQQEEQPASTTASKVDVDMYLEVSNGMKGFMPLPAAEKEPTVFQRQLNKLISEIQDGIYVDAKRYYLAGQNTQGQPVLDSVSYNTLKNTITSGIRADVRGTPLPDLLRAALENSVRKEAVSVIVSDFIHGPDPNNPGQFLSLDSDIRSSLKQAEHQNLVVAVLGNASPFFGNYFPAVKKPAVKRTLNGEEVPFYIWVIGKQQEVQTVINKVLRNLPAQQAYFGFAYPSVPYSALLKSNTFRPLGVVYCTSRTAEVCTSVNLKPEKEEPVEFTIGLNLSDFPASLQQVAFLKQHLKLAVTGGKASIGTVIAASEDVKATPELAKYTHFVRVRVPELTANTGSFTLQLPQVQPAWVNQWSTANDNNPAGAQRKTYQLNNIMEGVQALYRDKSENVFSITMKFNKETN
ncbi:hypothetical protein EFB08_05305 [Rufibacter latericius]|uniref:Uncharacterized protein n=1 Tax=Rufibacter latericius TaxID=2487040 RepID=A0A3M9MYV8_9BACT|nr:hypothetical protein EFB08_05305 [Rufibacter latericius]